MYEITVPEVGFSVKEATVVEWTKKVGETVQEGETIVVVETDKVAVQIPSLVSGILVEARFQKGDTVPVGAVLGLIAEEGMAGAVAATASFGIRETEVAEGFSAREKEGVGRLDAGGHFPGGEGKKRVSPAARKMAENENIDLSEIIEGSGPGGRIVKEDVLRLIAMKKSEKPEPREKPRQAEPGEKIPFVGWRKVIADRMNASAMIPQGRTMVEIDVNDLARLIRTVKEKENGPRITYLPFLMKAIQAGIGVTPEVNAYCYEDGFVLQKELNIGIAVDVEEKLIVPVIKKVRDKSILELAEQIQELALKARSNSLKPEDVQGGTITITNLGPYDVYGAMPLILQPQTTIVAMGTVRDQPAVIDGSIEIRKKVMVTGVFDHRAVNGAPGARFLKKVKDFLENLDRMVLGLR